MQTLKKGLCSLIALTLGSCGSVNIGELEAGRFDGDLHVVWLGGGERPNGSPLFLYVPDPENPLTFYRENPDGTINVITPPAMYTDGGSIPRPITLFEGFSPWGYGPAYIIHDWLFVAKHCVTDNQIEPIDVPYEIYEPYEEMEFLESAAIIAEAIMALQEQNLVPADQFSLQSIANAVAGPISGSIWREQDRCDGHQVSREDLAAGRLGIPRPASLRTLRQLDLPSDVPAGTTVATFSF